MKIKTFVGCFLVPILCLALVNESKQTPVFSINNICGERLVLINDALLKITNLGIDKACVVTMHTAYTQARYKLRAKMRTTKVRYTEKCKKVSMDFYDGPSLNSGFKLSGGVCSSVKVYETSSTYLTMDIRAKELIGENDDIVILVSAFHTGKCDTGEFHCSNSRCINNELVCNGHDNCGDESEERKCTYVIMAWMIVLLTMVCLLSVCTCIMCFCCRLCRRKRNAPLPTYESHATNALPSYSRLDPHQQYQSYQPMPSQPYLSSSEPPLPPPYATTVNKA